MKKLKKKELYNKVLQTITDYKDAEQPSCANRSKEGVEKEDKDPFCLNLTTIKPPHPGGA